MIGELYSNLVYYLISFLLILLSFKHGMNNIMYSQKQKLADVTLNLLYMNKSKNFNVVNKHDYCVNEMNIVISYLIRV